MFDKVMHECGVFGIYSKECASVNMSTYYALYALQHRGQESCGITVNDDGVFTTYKDLGLVPDVFTKEQLDKVGNGNIAIGHVRYSSNAEQSRANTQPLVLKHVKGNLAIATNSCLINSKSLREEYELKGGIFHTTADAEVIAYAITEERLKQPSIEEAVQSAMKKLKGAYALVIMSPQKLVAVRDPLGFRPLSMGKIGDQVVFASETCAFDSIGAEFVRDLEPGEVVVVDNKHGVRSLKENCGNKGSICVFEYIYFARPDSIIEGTTVHDARRRAGAFLAKESPVDADVVIGVPDSGLDAALGYSQESNIPYGVGFIKNRYVGRTFIQPTQAMRENAVKIKLNALKSTVAGKRVIMVDDSIVRGTTSAQIVKLLRAAGAKEVHMRVSSPKFINPCYFGTDIDSKDKLMACLMTTEEMEKAIGVDSLGFLNAEDVHKLAPEAKCDFCDGCFSGKYPIDVPAYADDVDKFTKKINSK